MVDAFRRRAPAGGLLVVRSDAPPLCQERVHGAGPPLIVTSMAAGVVSLVLLAAAAVPWGWA